MKKRCSRGFSLAEAVIALTVVALVSASALTVVLAARMARHTSANIAEAQAFAKNALVCFQATDFSEGDGEFLSYMSFAEGANMLTVGTRTYRYVSAKHKFEATVKLTDTKFVISIVDVEDGKSLVSFDYEKGGG